MLDERRIVKELSTARCLTTTRLELAELLCRGSQRSFHDLPERILARDLAIGELEQVHAAHFEPLPRDRRARERPFRDTEVAAGPVLVLPVMHVRNSLEALGQPCSDLLLPDVPIAPWSGTARHVEHTIVCEIAHDGVQIVTIECIQESLQKLYGRMCGHGRVSTHDASITMDAPA